MSDRCDHCLKHIREGPVICEHVGGNNDTSLSDKKILDYSNKLKSNQEQQQSLTVNNNRITDISPSNYFPIHEAMIRHHLMVLLSVVRYLY